MNPEVYTSFSTSPNGHISATITFRHVPECSFGYVLDAVTSLYDSGDLSLDGSPVQETCLSEHQRVLDAIEQGIQESIDSEENQS